VFRENAIQSSHGKAAKPFSGCTTQYNAGDDVETTIFVTILEEQYTQTQNQL
jgi:hypothetical protein